MTQNTPAQVYYQRIDALLHDVDAQVEELMHYRHQLEDLLWPCDECHAFADEQYYSDLF